MPHVDELIDTTNDSEEAVLTSGALFRSNEWRETNKVLPLMLGEGTDGSIVTLDLAKAPHVLVAGMAETGKSTLLHQFIWSLIFKHSPDDLRLILVDLKRLEYACYENLPHLHFPVINQTDELLGTLTWLVQEMEQRKKTLLEAHCRDIIAYNAQHPRHLPFFAVFIDELSEAVRQERTLMENLLFQLSGDGRSVGIHLIVSCGQLNRSILTDSIRCRFCTQIATRVDNEADSRRLLGINGAEYLSEQGDMLCHLCSEVQRVHSGFISLAECRKLAQKTSDLYINPGRHDMPVMSDTNSFAEKDKLRAHTQDRIYEIIHGVIEDNMDYLVNEIIDALMEEFEND